MLWRLVILALIFPCIVTAVFFYLIRGSTSTGVRRAMKWMARPMPPGSLPSGYLPFAENARVFTLDNVVLRYVINAAEIAPVKPSACIELERDKETNDFLENCFKFPQTEAGNKVRRSLSVFFSSFVADAILNAPQLYVLSEAHWPKMLPSLAQPSKSRTLLDVGAGSGWVTRGAKKHFSRIVTTEISLILTWRLRRHGFRAVTTDSPSPRALRVKPHTFDVVSCFNVLDRCTHPHTMLQQLKQNLKPGGRIVLAIVLPFYPTIITPKLVDRPKPSERMMIDGHNFETSVGSFVRNVLDPAGLVVESLSRVPYICQGDDYHPIYVLDDAVFVLSVA